MNIHTLPFRDTGHYSGFFCDYTDHGPFLADFFSADYRDRPATLAFASRLSKSSYPREALSHLLRRQNLAFGSSDKAMSNIDLLRDSHTLAIVTGQQVGILTGSLYTVYKTLSAITLSERLKKDFPDFNFVPVFWLEGEDHDYAEMSSVSLLSQNKAQTFTYREPRYRERQMLGRTTFSPEIFHFITDVLAAFPPSDFKSQVSDLLRETYKEGERFTSAFAKVMARLFAQEGLVLVESDDREYKQLAKDILIKELATQPQSSAGIISQSAKLEERGYTAQVKPRPVNLYMIDNDQRLAIESAASGFELKQTKQTFSKAELIELAEEHPEKFSPNVVLRPLVQDRVLPTLAYIAGPAEAAYFAQFKTNYQFFETEMPVIVPRACLTLVEAKVSKVFEKVGLSYKDFFAEREAAAKRLIAAASDVNLEMLFEKNETVVKAALTELETALKQLDPTLGESLQTATGKITHVLSGIKEKAARAEKQKSSELIAQLDKCAEHLFPLGELQERTLNIFYFLNKYGFGFIGELKQIIAANEPDKHLIIEL